MSKFSLEQSFEGMRKAGKLASRVLDFITQFVKKNVTTDELNTLCHDFIIQNNAIPAPLNYQGFPKSICTSVNHVVCHGIPSNYKLKNGDALNIDVTVIVDGWHGDTSRMYTIGEPPKQVAKLIDVTYASMMRAIEIVKPGIKTGDIGHAIQSFVEPHGFSVVRDFCGHGIGRKFHQEPTILHYGKPGTGKTLNVGDFFTIEPMINIGKYNVKILNDGWTAITVDKSISAQFEHTLGITESGYEIMTK